VQIRFDVILHPLDSFDLFPWFRFPHLPLQHNGAVPLHLDRESAIAVKSRTFLRSGCGKTRGNQHTTHLVRQS
jgi:hypothetical protein